MDLNSLVENGFQAYNSYANQKTAQAQADAAQQNAQAALNNASIINSLNKNKTTLAIIGAVVAIIVAYFMFKRK